jgi:hypothetical protein
MLVTFKSKAAAEVIMYEEHAKRILDMLGKDVEKGIITAEETGDAIARIEHEIEEVKKQAQAEKAQRAGKEDEDEEEEPDAAQAVTFSARVYPLLEMLRAAKASGQPVYWGV